MANAIFDNKKYGRVVLLVDMDCFFCQVEEKWDPSLKGKPVAVVQYNEWRGGGIIAVNYVARAQGVTRHMRGDEAKSKCPTIELVKVPQAHNKGNMTKYKDAGREVADVLQRFTKLLHRASVDEAYLDITDAVQKRIIEIDKGTYTISSHDLENTYIEGYEDIADYMDRVTQTLSYSAEEGIEEAMAISTDLADSKAVRSSDLRLLIGATIANEIRAAVKADTGYECSAGIAHNKILAKLACGMHKPNKQTILPLSSIHTLFSTLPVNKIRGLGGKFGEELCISLGIRYLGDLLVYSEAELQKKIDTKNGTWLYNVCRGIDTEPVEARFNPKSIGCSKQFPGPTSICDTETLKRWLHDLADELYTRLDRDNCENNRKPTQMIVTYVQDVDGTRVTNSRSGVLSSYDPEVLANNAYDLIKANAKPFLRAATENTLHHPIKLLGISAGKFTPIGSAKNTLKDMFAQQQAKRRRVSEEQADKLDLLSSNGTKSLFSINTKKVDESDSNESIKQKDDDQEEAVFVLDNASDPENEDDFNEEANLNDVLHGLENSNSAAEQLQEFAERETPQNNSTAQVPAYQRTYAEYALPELNAAAALPHKRCDICGVKVLDDARALQSHQDYHFALQLSQQQRSEFRAELQSKDSQPSTSKAAAAAVVANKKKVKSNPGVKITSFFKMGDTTTTSTVTSATQIAATTTTTAATTTIILDDTESDMLTCEQCNKNIAQTEWFEHQDFHVAEQLQKQWNHFDVGSSALMLASTTNTTPTTTATTTTTTTTATTTTNAKRKRKSTNSSSNVSTISQPIEKFFSQHTTKSNLAE